MRWRIVNGPEARADYNAAIDWYRVEAPEQVVRFRAEVRKTLKAITDNPFLSRDRGEGVRKRATAIFPYHVWYKVYEKDRKISVIAVLHYRRAPSLIQGRL
jgi:plasmid stabilization system protein ParE